MGTGHHGSKSAFVVIICQGGVYSDEALTGSILEIGFQWRVIAQCRPSDLQVRFAAFDRIIPTNTECRVLCRSVSSFLGNVLAGAFDFVLSHFSVERGGLKF